jgi:hypothetical protein
MGCWKDGVAMQVELCQTLHATAERHFVVLKYQGKVPTMAGGEKCQRKFLYSCHLFS